QTMFGDYGKHNKINGTLLSSQTTYTHPANINLKFDVALSSLFDSTLYVQKKATWLNFRRRFGVCLRFLSALLSCFNF
ncbi:hypothetical protein, partial [Corynebacterium callunae]|uniref:hypothetical protein n=1 Tax=Corynebacterium callunae TaxID=1721 RepID=UPI001FFE6486